MKIITNDLKRIFLSALVPFLFSASIANGITLEQYFLIDSKASSVKLESFFPDADTSPHPIMGSFRMVVDDDPSSNYFGLANLIFDNINVKTPALSNGPFNFPDYHARFEGPGLFGNQDDCFWFNLSGQSGTCWSMGNFGSFTGSYDGSLLTLTGSAPAQDSFTSYTFSISAEATPTGLPVPEPTTFLLMAMGLCLASLLRWKISR